MTKKPAAPLITELRKYLTTQLGLSFSHNNDKGLIKKINLAAIDFNFKDSNKFILWLLENNLKPEHTEMLASHLTIGETYFFREKKAFDYLERTYLPALITQRLGKDQRLKIWCAGCSSGEEPYSVAILLSRVLPDIKNWDITILATDINPHFLKKAEKAVYTEWSFRKAPSWLKTTYFKEVDKKGLRLIPEIKRMVTFAVHNLAEDTYPSLVNNTNAVDIIFCRNVLMYFSQDLFRTVTKRLYDCLIRRGVMIISPVETSQLVYPKFVRHSYSGITFYIKDSESPKKKSDITEKPEQSFVIESSGTQLSSEKQETAFFSPESTSIIPEFNLPETNPGKHVRKDMIKEDQGEAPEIAQGAGYEQALAFFIQGSYEHAEILLTALLNKDKENSKEITTLLARTKANLGKLDEAGLLCEKALEIDKLDPRIHYLLAVILSEQGKDEEAIVCLTHALFLDPDFALAHFLMGTLTRKMGRTPVSKKHFKNALTILSKHAPEETLTESDGLTAGRLQEIIRAVQI